MRTRTAIARIPLDDDTDLVVSLDAHGDLDLRRWTQTGHLKFPSKHGVTIPHYAVSRGDRRLEGGETEGGGMSALQARAKQAERQWRKTLNDKQRAKLDGDHLSKWAHDGGNFFVVKAPPTKRQMRQRREREQLKRQREACLRDERAAYEARKTRPRDAAGSDDLT